MDCARKEDDYCCTDFEEVDEKQDYSPTYVLCKTIKWLLQGRQYGEGLFNY